MKRSTNLSLSLSLCATAAVMLTSQAATAQGTQICDQTPMLADNPPSVEEGYFTSDIGMDGSGNVAIIGEFAGQLTDQQILEPGLARIYTQSSTSSSETWSQDQVIQHAIPKDFDLFGISVDISGNFAIISAPGRDSDPTNDDNTGFAYIFDRDIQSPSGVQWKQHSELENPGLPDDAFGGHQNVTLHEAVAIDGRLAAVSAIRADIESGPNDAGKVYIYSYDSVLDEWALEDDIFASDAETNAEFGYSIEISGDRIIVGAPLHGGGNSTGKAYVFKRDAATATWSQESDLLQSSVTLQPGDHFGWSVSIDGNGAVVGTPDTSTGNAFVFGFFPSANDWQEHDVLTPSNNQLGQGFGYNVSMSGTLVRIGANSYNSPENAGAAYLYQRSTSGWNEENLFLSDVGANGDRVGETLAISGDEAFVGVLSEDILVDPEEPFCGGGVICNVGALMIFSDVPGCDS